MFKLFRSVEVIRFFSVIVIGSAVLLSCICEFNIILLLFDVLFPMCVFVYTGETREMALWPMASYI